MKTGDVLLIRKNGFLPRNIRRFMKLWAKIHYGVKLDKYYNHMMIVTRGGEWEDVQIAEAIGKGFVQRKLSEGYKKSDDIIVYRLKKELTPVEQNIAITFAQELANDNIEYEILNFFWWIPYILSNGKIDLSPKEEKKENKLFCFEVVAMVLQAARPGLFETPDKVTSVDIQLDDRFYVLS